jgi:hypothetical protein
MRREGGVTFRTEDSQIFGATIQNSAARQSGAQDLWPPLKVFGIVVTYEVAWKLSIQKQIAYTNIKTLKP